MKKLYFALAAATLASAASAAPAGPTGNEQLISETPEGTEVLCQKQAYSYGYGQYTGLETKHLYGGLTRRVISADGKKMYLQNPVALNPESVDNWIVGEINGNEVSFTFPQLIAVIDKKDEQGNVVGKYYDYAMCAKYDSAQEWFFPTDNQVYTFILGENGVLEPKDKDTSLMLSYCAWVTQNGQSYWAWQGDGDIIYAISPITAKTVDTTGVEFDQWNLLSSDSYRKVGVAFKDNDVYVRGLFNGEGLEDATVKGTLNGDKVTFPTSQYLGAYWKKGTTAYFMTGTASEPDADKKVVFTTSNDLTFSYDATAKSLTTEGAYCVSATNLEIQSYFMLNKPEIAAQPESVKVTELMTPELVFFYDSDDTNDYDAQFGFIVATLDADRQPLDPERLSYQFILNNEIYKLYDDEYRLPEGVTEWSEVPYTYTTSGTSEILAIGNERAFAIHSRGFDNFGVRAIYTNTDGSRVESKILWAPGFTDVKGIEADAAPVRAEYFDLNGLKASANPAPGIYVRRATMADGSVRTSKVIVK